MRLPGRRREEELDEEVRAHLRMAARLVTVLHDGWKPVAPANFLDWREQSGSFESIAAAQSWGLTMTGRDRPEQLEVLQTSAEMFQVLGVDAALGRTFAAGEDQPGREHVVVLSHGFWQRRFGGADVVGQQVTLDGEAYTVVGVMPPDFQFAPFWATRAEAWVPLNFGRRVSDRRGQSLRVFARLKPGVTQGGVVVVNEALARRQWPGEEPLGKRMTVNGEGARPREVVGVVRDVKQGEWASAPQPEMYLPHSQAASPRSMTLVIRASPAASEIGPVVRREVWAIDADLPVSQVAGMEDVVSESVGQQRFNTLLIGLFAATALILAAVGVYGVMSHAVAQRTHEIGVRLALGARGRDVLGMIIRQGLALTLVGLAVGLAAAPALMRVMNSLLYEVSATDPLVFGGVAAALTLSALLACYVPARRATKGDPVIALRHE